MKFEWFIRIFFHKMLEFSKSPLFKSLQNDDIQCLCCQRKCLIHPGKLGHCRARGNIDGKPFSPVWGRYTVAIDPIEKKPLYHFFPGCKVFSYGTVGCNFGCQFCQNSSLSMWKLDIEDVKCLKQNDVGILEEYTPEEMVKHALRRGCKAIASTYNEPTISSEFSHEVFKLAKEKGLYTVYVTNGFESVETLNYLAPYLDAVNIDLKSFRDDFYNKICDANLEGVCITIRRCVEMGIHTEVTTLVIPGENDSDEELTDAANFLASIDKSIVWHLSAYHDDYLFHGRGVTPLSTLKRGQQIGYNAGLKYIYLGNVRCPDSNTTKCPKCGKKLIERSWHSANIMLKNGTCSCGEYIPGLFEDANHLKPKLNSVPEHLINISQQSNQQIKIANQNLVIYATKGGTSKQFAEKIAEKLGYEVLDIKYLNIEILSNLKNAVFCVSTYGKGKPPKSAQSFWNELTEFQGRLTDLKFTVLGCGSSSFQTFLKFAYDLESKLVSLGGNEVAPLFKHDEMDESDDSNNFDEWMSKLNF